MPRRRKERLGETEYMPFFEEPTDRGLFRRLVDLGILDEESERKDWYLWLLSLHNAGCSPEEIRRKSAARARENIQRLREHLRRGASFS